MPKTLTGEELQVDDAPARDSELFLVDGNNLAYRAFFALPEELATSDGFSTNALLGFTNMLFKLLADYKPKGVAVAWDTRPVHRAAVSEDYKSERKPMPDLLREQFPYFRPIVEAFGYRNLEFEGWEADDVIATLATQADEAGIKTTVVSTDRDAFQLVSDNVTLMMTPRGVSDVHVYTPERVEARYGIRPEQVPDFIGLKGDTSDNIPGVPGIGDKTAGQLIGQYGSLEDVIDHADELSPARRKNITEHADQARQSKDLATMRRDLELDCDVTQLVLAPPDRSQLKEMFRRFEFRNLLRPRRRARRRRAGGADGARADAGSVARGAKQQSVARSGAVGLRERRRVAWRWRPRTCVVVSPPPSGPTGPFVVHDAKAQRVEAEDDTLLARVPDRAVASRRTRSTSSRPSTASSSRPDPAAEEETAALVRTGRRDRCGSPSRCSRACASAGMEPLYREIELPLSPVLAAMEVAGVKIDEYRMGEITARLRERVEELEARALRARGRGVHARLDPAGRPDPVREARADARAARGRPATRPTPASCARSAASTRSSP